jgi:protein associated with RNAse G/E
MRPVVVQFLKYPDILHWGFEASYLGEDEYGDWVAVPAGSRRWKGEVSFKPTKAPAVFCAPSDAWWHLHYSGAAGDTYSHFVDIVTPRVWRSENRYEMVDLDLDLAIRHDGDVEIQDEDEFLEHQVRYGYSEEMIDRATGETERIRRELESRHEPFFEVAEAWLRRV